MKPLRIGILALLAFSVIAFGGVEPWARAVFETGTALLFLYWAIVCYRRGTSRFHVPPLVLPLLVLCLLVLLQWAFRWTASPFATRVELQLLLAEAFYLFLAVQSFRALRHWKTFVWFLMGFGFLVALIGILQHLTFNGKLYWVRSLRFGGIPFGPYANRNHFACLMEMTIPLTLVPLAFGRIRRERQLLVGVFAIVQIGALFLSASRGGIVSLSCQLLILAFWLFSKRVRRSQMLAGGAVLLIALSLVYWLGADRILQRFSSMQSLEMTAGKRASMRLDTWHIFRDHPFFGTGLGTLPIVFPRYETNYDGKFVNHTHNDYLEALADTGILGGLCCAWFLFALFRAYFRRARDSTLPPFIAALNFSGFLACVGFLIHGLVDFNLHIPANATLFFLMAALATAEISPDKNVPRSRPRDAQLVHTRIP